MPTKVNWFTQSLKKVGAIFVPKREYVPSEWRLGQEVLGEYVVERKLGKGGMGVVYLLKHKSTGNYYAVKRAQAEKEENLRSFLEELQVWMDLPLHPHVLPCNFFRTVGSEIIIFTEYMGGGSVKDWIEDKRLYEGGRERSLGRILDIAIQASWGLHALHTQGYIHQDVKPQNILISKDGIVKVADFGLVKARMKGGVGISSPDMKGTLLVSCGGYTEAYCSPEQLARKELTRRTDVWSLGVSVLEMFLGGVVWQIGVAAPRVLESYSRMDREGYLPEMPEEVRVILTECFRGNPDERIGTALELSERFREVYLKYFGSYSREVPPFPEKVVHEYERRGLGGAGWEDPRYYLRKAYRLLGKGAEEVERVIKEKVSSLGSRQAQAVQDMVLFDEVVSIYEELIKAGRDEFEELWRIYNQKALVHETLGDYPGAISMYDKAISIYEDLVYKKGRTELLDHLATSFINKGNTLSEMRRLKDAADTYSKGISILENLVYEKGILIGLLIKSYNNMGVTLRSLGKLKEALEMHNKAIERGEKFAFGNRDKNFLIYLALNYGNRGNTLCSFSRFGEAIIMFDKSIALWKVLVYEGGEDFFNEIARNYNNKGFAIYELGMLELAIKYYDKAIPLYEELIYDKGRIEFSNDLLLSYSNKALALKDLGKLKEAINLHDRAISLCEMLVYKRGKIELLDSLAMVYGNKSATTHESGEYEKAIEIINNSIRLYEELVYNTGRIELSHYLAISYSNKGAALKDLGRLKEAVEFYDKAISILEDLVHGKKRWELCGNLANAKIAKAVALIAQRDISKASREVKETISLLNKGINETKNKDLVYMKNLIQSEFGELTK